MVTRLNLQGRTAWLKSYGGGSRRLRLRALELTARRLGVPSLRPPPHRVGADARQTEQRRLQELAAVDVRVPSILGEGDTYLLLSDIGETLSARLRRATPQEAYRLVTEAARTLAQVHARGGYIGQPLARNLTVDEHGRIGFIDFEEDPAEVMTVQQAQIRDWLIFAAGTSRYFRDPDRELSAIIAESLRGGAEEVRRGLGDAADRLGFVQSLTRWLGRRARGLGGAVQALRRAAWVWALCAVLIGLGVDFAPDRDFDSIRQVAEFID
ncbi:serine/threonine protein phosphatase [Lysobacter enzymogenes]|uniref:phosphotransferase n=1 Tax=Lysobacter enzymogenes TaxID=69 RepID=UPI0037481F34